MDNDTLERLLSRLKEKTSSNQIFWLKTSSQNEYRIRLGKSIITIDNWADKEGSYYADLTIYNWEGDVIDNFIFHPNDQYYADLINLYNLIIEKANNNYETYNDIFSALN